MINTFLWIVAALWLVALGVFLFIKKVPHGWVQFRTGLVLRFLPALDSQPVVDLRNSIEHFVSKKLPAIKKSLPIDEVKDVDIPTRHGSISARVFKNHDQIGSNILVLIHGGGWCIGSSNSYEEVSRRLVRETGCALVSLDYSLSPEIKFPHAHEECLDAVAHLTEHASNYGLNGDQKLILVGDSAGGNLIISTTYDLTENQRNKIDKLVAVYPAVDGKKTDYKSNIDFAKGYYLTQKSMQQFTEAMITSKEQLEDLRMSPIDQEPMPDFPETFVLTAEFDPLRDQSEAFASKLQKEGITVLLKRYKGTIHAFFGLKDFGSQSLQCIKDIGSFIRNEAIAEISKFS